MPGATRRSKPLKAKSLAGDIDDFSISNAAEGDLLIFDDVNDLWKNGKTLTGNYSMVGTVTVTTLLATNATISDDLVVSDDLSVAGNTSLTGALTVGGAGTFDTTLAVTGAATLSSTLSLAGTLTGAGFSFGTGTITTLTVTTLTATTLALASLTLSGSLSVGTTLVVTGISIFTDDVTINASLSAGQIVGTTLGSSGDITGSGNLDITGALSTGGNLTIGGATLTMDGLAWVLASSDITATLTSTSGKYIIKGLEADDTVQTMFTLDPAGHHIFGGTDALLIPVGTTAQAPSGAAGMVRFDSTTTKFRGYEAAWDNFAMDSDLHAALVQFVDNGDVGEIKHAGTLIAQSSSDGLQVLGKSGSHTRIKVISAVSGTEDAIINAYNSAGNGGYTLWMDDSASIFRLHQANTSGSSVKAWIEMDMDGPLRLYHNDTVAAQTVAAASGGLQANNTSTGAGLERVLTTSDKHTRSHAITGTSDHTANNWKTLYTDGSGDIKELALPTTGKVLTGAGTSSAPTWETPAAVHTRLHAITDTADHSAGNWKVLYTDGSGDIKELALPASGDVLTGAGVGAAPTWETPGAAHTRLHAVTDTSDHSAGNWKILYSDGSGEIQELALPASGDVLTGAGVGAAPTWETPSGSLHTRLHTMTDTSDHSAGTHVILYSDASGDIKELALPSSGKVLTGAGTSSAPTWETPAAVHTRSHAMTGTSDHSAGNHKIFFSDASGNVIELALPASGDVLTGAGTTSAPTWETPSGSGLTQFNDNSLVGEWNYNAGTIGKSTTTGIEIVGTAGGHRRIRIISDVGTTEDAILSMHNTVGGGVTLWMDDSAAVFKIHQAGTTGGSIEPWIEMVKNGVVRVYYNGIQSLEVDSVGSNFSRTTGGTSVNRMRDASFNNEGGLFSTTVSSYIYTYVHGGSTAMWAEDAGGTAKLCFRGDGDGLSEVFYAGVMELFTKSGGVVIDDELEINGALNHDGSTVGFYGTAPLAIQTGVAVTAAGVHAALVALGLITA